MLNNPAAKTTTTSNSEKQSINMHITAETHTSPKVLPTPSSLPLARDPTSQGCVAPTPMQSNMANEKVTPSSSLSSTLDSKIDNLLQGHPGPKGFNLGFPSVLTWLKEAVDSPSASTENLGGTPVRDEAGATPTQDEIMDVPQSELFPYQQGQTVPISTTLDAKSTCPLPSWQEQKAHADPQAHTDMHQKTAPKKVFRNSVPSLAEAEAMRHQRIEAMRSSSLSSNQQPLSVEATERSVVMLQELRQNPLICDVGPNSKIVEGSYAYRDDQEKQVLTSSDAYGAEPYLAKEPRQDLLHLTSSPHLCHRSQSFLLHHKTSCIQHLREQVVLVPPEICRNLLGKQNEVVLMDCMPQQTLIMNTCLMRFQTRSLFIHMGMGPLSLLMHRTLLLKSH